MQILDLIGRGTPCLYRGAFFLNEFFDLLEQKKLGSQDLFVLFLQIFKELVVQSVNLRTRGSKALPDFFTLFWHLGTDVLPLRMQILQLTEGINDIWGCQEILRLFAEFNLSVEVTSIVEVAELSVDT